jgi:hypothetical protein
MTDITEGTEYPPVDLPPSGLAARLAQRFPSVPATQISAIVGDARRSVELFGLSREDEAAMTERLASELLMQLVGERPDRARLDPERHQPRKGEQLNRRDSER